MSYIYDLTDTWNAAGTVFTAIKMNVTNSASASGSKLIDLQIGGTSLFNVDKSGNAGIGTSSPVSNAGYGGLSLNGSSGSIISMMQGGAETFRVTNATGYSFVNTTGATPLLLGTNATERMRIDSSGNLGIGTSSPTSFGAGSTMLTVAGTSTYGGYLGSTNTVTVQFWANEGSLEGYLGTRTSHPLVFTTGNTERMRIDSAGNVGIGTSAPVSKLDVRSGYITAGTAASTEGSKILGGYYSSGNIATFGGERSNGGPVIGYGVWPSPVAEASFVSATGINVARGAYTMVGNVHKWFAGGAQTVAVDSAVSMSEVMRLDASGNVGIGTSSPTERLQVAGSVKISGSVLVGTGTASAPTLGFEGWIGTGIWNPTGTSLGFSTNGSERMRINASGNVGIGTTSPYSKLDVVGASNNLASTVQIVGSGVSSLILGQNASGGVIRGQGGSNALSFWTGGSPNTAAGGSGTERMRITNEGNIQLGTASLATTATDGFPYIPTCAGTPTGTPTPITGYAPMVVDSTNNKLYVYVGGAWQAMN